MIVTTCTPSSSMLNQKIQCQDLIKIQYLFYYRTFELFSPFSE
jgi:hypothetical protein